MLKPADGLLRTDARPSPLASTDVKPLDSTTGEFAPSATEGDPTLCYGSDEPVSDNKAEIQYYQAYLTAEKRIPESVEALRQWVRDTPKK